MTIQDLKDKKIVVAGMGINNRSMADYFSRRGIKYDVVENWTSMEELGAQLLNYDIVFRTPGLPYLSEPIQIARKAGAQIFSQTRLFFDLCPCPIIGVTGTKGKGTTSSLIYAILLRAGRQVFLGGNFGKDPFEFLDSLTPESLVVLELSSFQLQDLEKSPHVAVVLNITPDHLNHHKDWSEYVAAKSSIVKYQTESDLAILHPNLPEDFREIGRGRKVLINPNLVKDWPRKLLGIHNLDNIAAAAMAAKAFDVPELVIKSAVLEFEPLPHRLRPIRDLDDVIYYDDGYSTNVDPVKAAIEAVPTPMVLIVGGFDKGLDFTEVGRKIVNSGKVKGVVVIGQMTEKIVKALAGFPGKILTGAVNTEEFINQARSLAGPGDSVVFSPGTASFDMYKNETDRAEQFVAAVNNLK